MKLRILKRLLNRYHDGTASGAEKFIVDRWYDSFGTNGPVPGLENEQAAQETGERIFNRIRIMETARPWYYSPGFKIACSIAFVSALFLFLHARLNNEAAIANSIVYQTSQGQIKKILLKDNSCIWLNSGSRLEILPAYAEKKREMKLEGEAYFEVSHNAKQPFLVHTGKLITNVLGTSFTVQAYKKARFARVTLLTGKVWVKVKYPESGQLSGAMLLPNQRLQYDYDSKTITKTDVASPASSRAWIDGKLIFDNTPMPEVSETLSRAFGLNVKVSGAELNNRRIYGQFNITDRPEITIKMICKLINANYTVRGNEVDIRAEGYNNK